MRLGKGVISGRIYLIRGDGYVCILNKRKRDKTKRRLREWYIADVRVHNIPIKRYLELCSK